MSPSGGVLGRGLPNLFLLALLDMCSIATSNITPIMLGLLVDRVGLSERMAGLAVSAEILGFIAGLALFNLALGRWGRVRLARVGMVLVGLGSALTLLLPGLWIFGARFTVGAGVGTVLALIYNVVSMRDAPQRYYAALSAITLIYSAILLLVCSALARSFGLVGVCSLIIAHALIGFVVAGRVPATSETRRPSTAQSASSAVAPRVRLTLVALSAAAMLVYIGHTALWSFQERMALAAGAAPAWMGTLLAMSALGGVVGAALAFKLGESRGVILPQVMAYVMIVASALMLSGHWGLGAFAVGAVVIKVGWFLGYPYIQGSISTLDPSGRWASVAGALQSLGTAAGPALAALVVIRGYDSIVAVALIAYGLSAILALTAARRVGRARVGDTLSKVDIS